MGSVQHIFVGDVQGCADELEELLARVREAFGARCELWFVGDLVNRGPESVRALAMVRELVDAGRARLVLGNHELALLRVAFGLRDLSPFDTFGELLVGPDASEWVEWLRRCPLVETGRLGRQRVAMVHAAVHPDWGLDELVRRARRLEARLGHRERNVAIRLLAAEPAADADRDLLGRLTSCRSVSSGDEWSTSPPEEPEETGLVAWHERWSARGHRWGVVYGHWSLQGLHVAPRLRGLDTGCVHHGRGRDGFLTAWLPDPAADEPFGVPDTAFWQIPARRAYYAHRDAPRA